MSKVENGILHGANWTKQRRLEQARSGSVLLGWLRRYSTN